MNSACYRLIRASKHGQSAVFCYSFPKGSAAYVDAKIGKGDYVNTVCTDLCRFVLGAYSRSQFASSAVYSRWEQLARDQHASLSITQIMSGILRCRSGSIRSAQVGTTKGNMSSTLVSAMLSLLS